MEFKDKREYWRKYGMIKGDYLFRTDEILDEHRNGRIGLDEFYTEMGELLTQYKKDCGIVRRVAGASLARSHEAIDLARELERMTQDVQR